MMTIDEAITARLEQKRQEREHDAWLQQERERIIAQNEADVKEQACHILSDCLEIDFASIEVKAAFSHEADYDQSYYKIALMLNERGYVETNSNILASTSERLVDPETLLSAHWRAIHFDGPNAIAVSGDNLIDMIIFAKYGIRYG